MKDYQKKYNQAVSAYLLEDYELAEKITRALLKRISNDALLYILSGNIYEALRDFEKAAREYKKAIGISPDNPEAYNNLGVTYKNTGDFSKSEIAFKQAMALAPERADLSYNYANMLKKQGDLKAAETTAQVNPFCAGARGELFRGSLTFLSSCSGSGPIAALPSSEVNYAQVPQQSSPHYGDSVDC